MPHRKIVARWLLVLTVFVTDPSSAFAQPAPATSASTRARASTRDRAPGDLDVVRLPDVWVDDPDKPNNFRLGELPIRLRWIPPGRFVMGSPPDEAGREKTEGPQHAVELPGFWMSETEMTHRLFECWRYSLLRDEQEQRGGPLSPERTAALKLPRPKYPYLEPDFNRARTDRANVPMTSLTPQGAQAFCRWLSVRTGRPFRLPTEAEWEYAARAGSPAAWPYPNAPDALADHAWFSRRRADGAGEVGRKRPNAWNLHDMHGNVAEWVLDAWTEDYSTRAGPLSDDPWTPRNRGSFGVARGGDWTSPAAATRSAARRKIDCRSRYEEDLPFWFDTSDQGRMIGVRLVSPAAPEKPDKADSIQEPAEQRG